MFFSLRKASTFFSISPALVCTSATFVPSATIEKEITANLVINFLSSVSIEFCFKSADNCVECLGDNRVELADTLFDVGKHRIVVVCIALFQKRRTLIFTHSLQNCKIDSREHILQKLSHYGFSVFL